MQRYFVQCYSKNIKEIESLAILTTNIGYKLLQITTY